MENVETEMMKMRAVTVWPTDFSLVRFKTHQELVWHEVVCVSTECVRVDTLATLLSNSNTLWILFTNVEWPICSIFRIVRLNMTNFEFYHFFHSILSIFIGFSILSRSYLLANCVYRRIIREWSGKASP